MLMMLIAILPLSASAVESDLKPLGVRQLMQNVSKHTGNTQVEGVVAQVSPEHQLVGLIDRQEFEECNSVTCAKLILPVRWKGEMPEIKDHLLIEGLVGEEQGRMMFMAESLKTL